MILFAGAMSIGFSRKHRAAAIKCQTTAVQIPLFAERSSSQESSFDCISGE